jgi:3-hydroxyisobutyrate dehydrogenase-like beta-hydroxyacid dehydrogenase
VTRFGVLGLGEAGGAIAADLVAAGADVRGYDPADVPTPSGVGRAGSGPGAVAGAEVVLAVTSSKTAFGVLDGVADALERAAIYADLSTSSPALERRLAERAGRVDVGFVDVALMAPVPGNGLRTPALASGRGAERFAAIMVPLGMAVEVAGDEAGLASTRKLLRSVVTKGLAQLLVESLQAAEAAGLAGETWDNLVAQLASVDEALVRRLVSGTARHAARRVDEMEATAEMLSDLGVDPTMTRATLARLRTVAADPDSVPPTPPPPELRQ